MPRVPLFWPSLIAAAVAIGATAARGQQDLDAGKTGPQLFAQDCSACHRSPQGLVKSMSGGSLVSFLRQHYTSSSSSANALAGYLQSAGAPPRAPERPKGRAAEEPANNPAAARDRSKQARPAEPAAAPSSADAPGGALTPRKQREQVARPGDASTDQPAKGSRKSRRAPVAEPPETTAPPVPTEPVPTTAAVQPTAPSGQPASPAAQPAEPAATRAAAPSAAGEAAARPAAPPPGFSEPLP